MAGAKADGDAIEEIRIATFWRRHLGEIEYVYHDAEDLRRWYKALELRGPHEVREHLISRMSKREMTHLHGLAAAPHPPISIVELWLEARETEFRMLPAWMGVAGFTLLTLMIGYNLNGCQTLKDPNPLIKIAQQTQLPIKAASKGTIPLATATLPISPPPAPASQATQSTQQGSSQGH